MMSSFGVSPPNLERIFAAFSSSGALKSDGKELSLASCERWMEQANLLGECVSSEDLRLVYKKYKRRTLDFDTFTTVLREISDTLSINQKNLEQQLTSCGMPGLHREKPIRTIYHTAAGDQTIVATKSQSGTQQEIQQECIQGSGEGLNHEELQLESQHEPQQGITQQEYQEELQQENADESGESVMPRTQNWADDCEVSEEA